jgi:hypothetical protein
MEAIGLRVPGPNAQLDRVKAKGSAAGQRLGLTAQTDPVAVPQVAAPPPNTTPLTSPPSALQGGAEAGERPGLTARTDPARAPPSGTLPIIYMPDTESISDDEMPDRPITPPRPIPVLETRTVHFAHTIPSHLPSSPQPGPSRIPPVIPPAVQPPQYAHASGYCGPRPLPLPLLLPRPAVREQARRHPLTTA